MIEIILNGEPRAVPEGLTLAGLLDHLGIPPDRVAIEFNGEIARKPAWESTAVTAGAAVEIVHFVGGGLR